MGDDSLWGGGPEETEIEWFGGSAPPLRLPPPPQQQQQQQHPTPPSARPRSDDDLDNIIRSGMSNSSGSGSSGSGSSGSDDGMQDDERELQPQEVIVPQPTFQREPGTTGNDIAPASLVAALPTPATHAYLGEATTGSTLSRKDLEVGSTVEMPILSLPGVVLFPGESLPLRLHNAHATLAQSMLAEEARWTHGDQGQASRHLGVVNRLTSRSGGLLVRTSPVGTTAEIRSGHGGSVSVDADGSGLAIMARGRHRFRLVEDLGWRRGVRYWKVVISPDLCTDPLRAPLPRAFRDSRGGRHWTVAIPRFVVDANSPTGLVTRATSLLRRQREHEPPTMASRQGGAARAGGGARGGRYGGRTVGGGVADASAAAVVVNDGGERSWAGLRRGGSDEARARGRRGWGAFADGDSPEGGETRAQEGVKDCDEGQQDGEDEEKDEWRSGRGGKLDPTLFSYWLAANLPLDDDARQELLRLDSVVMRLRLEVKHLQLSSRRALCCASCDIGVAWEGDVFTLPGAEGVVGAYVNAMGYVHQTVTVRDARNIALRGEPEVQDSWFPGYAWITAYCKGCLNHLGWRFVSVRRGAGRESGTVLADAGEELGPASFFGLRRPTLVHQQEEPRVEVEENRV